MTFLKRYRERGQIDQAQIGCALGFFAFLILSFSRCVNATPIEFYNTSNSVDAQTPGGAYGVKLRDMPDIRYAHAEKAWSFENALFIGFQTGGADWWAGSASHRFTSLHGISNHDQEWSLYSNPENSGSGESLGNSDGAEFVWRLSTGSDALADFLAKLRFATTDWQASLDSNSHATQQMPAPPVPAISQRNSRECTQSLNWQKRGPQEVCVEGNGLTGGGVRAGASGLGSAAGRGSGGNGNSYRSASGPANNMGDRVGGTIPGGGGGSSHGGASNGGGGGANFTHGSVSGGGTGSMNDANGLDNGPGTDNGGVAGGGFGENPGMGNGGGYGSGGGWNQSAVEEFHGADPAEIRTIPEPGSVSLLALGLAGVYVTLRRGDRKVK